MTASTSHDATPFGLAAARVTRTQLDRKTRLKLERGDSPRSGEKVWRNSYYEGTLDKRLWRPFMDRHGIRGCKRRIGALLKSARELERRTRFSRRKEKPGSRNGVIGQIGLDVLDVLYNRFLDYKTGQLDPAIATIADAVGCSYAAAHAALRRLRDHGFLHWIRRSRPTETAGGAGPQVEQITNAYVLMMPESIEGLVRHLTEGVPIPADAQWLRDQRKAEWDAMVSRLSAVEFLDATWNGDRLTGETFAAIARELDRRESSRNGETGRV